MRDLFYLSTPQTGVVASGSLRTASAQVATARPRSQSNAQRFNDYVSAAALSIVPAVRAAAGLATASGPWVAQVNRTVALAKAGKDFEFITLKGEGHGFSSDANMQLWLDKLDAFLAKYNPAS